MHEKLEIYRKHGAREYIAWRVEDESIQWFALKDDRFEVLPSGADGIIRSKVFPGLWLDVPALLSGDMERVVQAVQAGIASAEHADFVATLRTAALK